MTTLKQFLKDNDACHNYYNFAKDLTLKQFLNTCDRGDWILWLFVRTNPKSLRELTLAKGHCANTVRHLMKDERSIKAVDAAIAFGECRIDRFKLDAAANAAADNGANDPENFAAAADAAAAFAAYTYTYAAYAPVSYVAAAYASAYDADASYATAANICRKYLPLEIWDQSTINNEVKDV